INLLHSSITGDVTAGSFGTAPTAAISIYNIQTLPSGAVTGSVYTPLNLSAKKGGADLQRLVGTTSEDMTFAYNTTGTTVRDFMNWMERTLGIDSSAGETVLSGNAAAGSTTTSLVLDAETAATFETAGSTSTSDTQLLLKIVSGTGAGQSVLVNPSTAYTAATNTFAFGAASAWGIAADATSQIVVQRMTSPHDGRFSADEPVASTKLTDFITTATSANNSSVQVDPTVLQATIASDRIHVGDIVRFTGSSGDAQGKIAVIRDINRATGVITFNVDGSSSGLGLTDSVGALITPPSGAHFDVLGPAGVGFSSDGVLKVNGNLGQFNDITDLTITDDDNATLLQFTQDNNATGESGRTTFVVYDSTGNPKEVSVSFYLESRTDSTTSIRWIAESPNDTDLDESVATAVSGGTLTSDNGRVIGGGRVVFDENGQFASGYPSGSSTVVIDAVSGGAGASLSFALDFSNITSLSNGVTDINMLDQDGMPEGVLESFSVGVDGVVTGVFSNGSTRSIAQIALGRFNNPQGLVELGDNLFRIGPNSGSVQIGTAGTDGRGLIRGGALESSNVDLSRQFTDLITTQRGFQASARIISTADELLQELVNLKR
ncbi:MAG: flagellar hook-basal body complex protein, partial [Planctomycetota bacterium]